MFNILENEQIIIYKYVNNNRANVEEKYRRIYRNLECEIYLSYFFLFLSFCLIYVYSIYGLLMKHCIEMCFELRRVIIAIHHENVYLVSPRLQFIISYAYESFHLISYFNFRKLLKYDIISCASVYFWRIKAIFSIL